MNRFDLYMRGDEKNKLEKKRSSSEISYPNKKKKRKINKELMEWLTIKYENILMFNFDAMYKHRFSFFLY